MSVEFNKVYVSLWMCVCVCAQMTKPELRGGAFLGCDNNFSACVGA